MSSPYLSFGLPHDVAAYAALAAALVCFALRKKSLGTRGPWLAILCGLAALLSAGYVAHYLRGGPRIVDATSYWLEARALAGGELAFDVPTPASSFRGRFLVTAPGDAEHVAVIFPPGYPALLAVGFLLHAPLLVGPLVAALLVLATYWLCRELLGREDVARLAALLSVLCAALRYHTADTMAHGLCALLFSASLAAAARGGRALLLSGLLLGWLVATRPLSGAVALVVCAAVALRHGRRALLLAPAMIPGVALLLLHQRAATGDWLGSAQLHYYALADGPPGCFRWGLGGGIGCLFEHGDFVRARLAHGYGLLEAAQNTLRRLAVHTIDIANFAPLSLLVPFALVKYRQRPGVLALGAGALGLVLAYAGFYFDGSYPGGGARLFADVLPLEHALLALGLIELRLAALAPAAALLGFALHAVHGHRALAAREGGRPMFEAQALAAAGVARGLVFVSTDHAFNLGHDPAARDPWHGLLVARLRGDARDALLWERHGQPPAFVYRYDAGSPAATPRLERYLPERSERLRFESESDWPLLGVSGGYAHPDFHPHPCVSSGRGLRLTRTGPDPLSVELEVVPRNPGPHELVVQWLADQTGQPLVELELERDAKRRRAELLPASDGPCRAQATKPIELSGASRVTLRWASRSVLLDYIEVRPLVSKMR